LSQQITDRCRIFLHGFRALPDPVSLTSGLLAVLTSGRLLVPALVDPHANTIAVVVMSLILINVQMYTYNIKIR
jgi:hypothetical protein